MADIGGTHSNRGRKLFPTERETPLRRDNVWYLGLLVSPQVKAGGVRVGNVPGSPSNELKPVAQGQIDDKVAADQRDHGLGVSSEVYSISCVQQKIDAAKRLDFEVIQ